jgi:hypothetical protein
MHWTEADIKAVKRKRRRALLGRSLSGLLATGGVAIGLIEALKK